jgi:hypothetical protein
MNTAEDLPSPSKITLPGYITQQPRLMTDRFCEDGPHFGDQQQICVCKRFWSAFSAFFNRLFPILKQLPSRGKVWWIHEYSFLKRLPYFNMVATIDQSPQSQQKKTRDRYEELSQGYQRLRYFFNSFILLNSGVSQFDNLVDQTRLWRTGRAIWIATVIWTVEATIGLFIWPFIWSIAFRLFSFYALLRPFPFSITLPIVCWLGLLVLTYITARMALSPYSRMCSTLFSLVYLTYKKLYEGSIPSDVTSKGQGDEEQLDVHEGKF